MRKKLNQPNQRSCDAARTLTRSNSTKVCSDKEAMIATKCRSKRLFKSRARMFPVLTSKAWGGGLVADASSKVRVFRHHHKIVAEGKRVDGLIRCAVADGRALVWTASCPAARKRMQSWWQMSIHEKFHASIRCWLRALREQAANSRQARRSSRSRSGNSARTSSNESPPARYSMIDSTGYRRPRMTGFQ